MNFCLYHFFLLINKFGTKQYTEKCCVLTICPSQGHKGHEPTPLQDIQRKSSLEIILLHCVPITSRACSALLSTACTLSQRWSLKRTFEHPKSPYQESFRPKRPNLRKVSLAFATPRLRQKVAEVIQLSKVIRQSFRLIDLILSSLFA